MGKLDVEASISFVTEETKGHSAEVGCPEGAYCCLAVTPTLVHVKGQKIDRWKGQCANMVTTSKDAYELKAPKFMGNGDAEMTFEACITPDSPVQDIARNDSVSGIR